MSTVETDPPKAQRHLAAILATDVVRSSWHMERKEAETILRLRDLRQNLIEPKVAEHRGRVFKTMGDGFLAEFVSALDAVHCAVDIQRLMAERNLDLPKDDRLELRIGINLGDVFREGDDVFGDGVNVAARLESSAPPGGIRVSRSVCDPIRDRFSFDFDDLGEHQFHNITRPIHVFGVRIDGEPASAAAVAGTREPLQKRRALGGASIATLSAVAVIVLVAAGWWSGAFNIMTSRPVPPTASVPPQPSAAPAPVAPPAPVPAAPSVDSELLFWQTIVNSASQGDFEEYLRKYPEGQFAGLARNRLAALRPPLAPAPAPAEPAPSAAVVAPPTPAEGEAIWSIEQKREVQRALRTLGEYSGDADGGFGPGTRAAIKQFQSFIGNPETGILSEDERKALLDTAQRLAALLDQPAESPQGVAASSIKGADQRYARAWAADTGKGARQDPSEASYWYALAAADGDARAYANLGTLVARGYGAVKPDPAGAAALWQAAAARGQPIAMFNLGIMYERGIGVAADRERAKAWYERAAAHGHPDAQAALKRL